MSSHNGLRHFVACVARTFHLWPLISKTGIYNYARHRKYPDTLVFLDVVITECCSLKCRNCSNLMQYYHKPENLDPEEVISSLRRLFKAVRVSQLKILGGEPFVSQKVLMRVLEYLREEALDRFDEVEIITNGTIMPSEECISAMKETPKLKVLFSNYGELSSRLEEFMTRCKNEGINCDVAETDYWWDFGGVETRDEKERRTQHRYDACYSRKHCNTLFRGKLYACPRQAHAVRLGLTPEVNGEFVDVLSSENEDPAKLHEAIYRLIDRKERITMCRACGCDSNIKIERAVQTERPIDARTES